MVRVCRDTKCLSVSIHTDQSIEIFDLCSAQTLENADMEQEMTRPITEREEKKHKVDIPREKIEVERVWNKRPDGFTVKMPTTEWAF